MRTVQAVLDGLVAGEDREQVRAVLGDADTGALVADLEAWLGPVRGCTYDHVSVGVTLELDLGDRLVVLKADRSVSEGALRVQAAVAAAGGPAPAVLEWPRSWGAGRAWVVEAADRGEPTRYTPAIREEMARTYARLLAMAPDEPDLPDGRPPADALWPEPHSVIFDFDGTRESATEIDAIAAGARERVLAIEAPDVVAHTDWARQNVAFRGGRIVSVFDWDGVARLPEVLAVAAAAAFHSHDWRLGEADPDFERYWLSADETLAFVRVVEAERGVRYDADELLACLRYRLAYQARCQHAYQPDREGPAVRRLRLFCQTRYAEVAQARAKPPARWSR